MKEQDLCDIDNQLAEKIRQKVYEQFEKQYFKKFKNQIRLPETVLSAFVIVDINQLQEDITQKKFLIVSIGFGTKSLPYSIAAKHKGFILKDMHAQILARRGFCKFVVNNLPQKMHTNQYFDWNQKRQKHQLKKNYKIILFSSEIFCGDCCIDQSTDLFSGAKPLQYFNQAKIPQQKYRKGCLRTKPGRLDLPLQKRTLSLSCSDKISLWNILGIQGKRLFKLITPIYISSIIIEIKRTGIEVNKHQIKQGIDLINRLSMIRGDENKKIHQKIFYLKINGKNKCISYQFKRNQPHLLLLQVSKSHKIQDKPQQVKNKTKMDLCGIISSSQTQWINSKTGLPQGLSINKYQEKNISRFSSRKMYKNLQQLQNIDYQSYHRIQQVFKYAAIKENIKRLFGIWTTDFKQS